MPEQAESMYWALHRQISLFDSDVPGIVRGDSLPSDAFPMDGLSPLCNATRSRKETIER
jgi:hypothetical protein